MTEEQIAETMAGVYQALKNDKRIILAFNLDDATTHTVVHNATVGWVAEFVGHLIEEHSAVGDALVEHLKDTIKEKSGE